MKEEALAGACISEAGFFFSRSWSTLARLRVLLVWSLAVMHSTSVKSSLFTGVTQSLLLLYMCHWVALIACSVNNAPHSIRWGCLNAGPFRTKRLLH